MQYKILELAANVSDDFSITEDEEFQQELTEEVWKENFDKVGYISGPTHERNVIYGS